MKLNKNKDKKISKEESRDWLAMEKQIQKNKYRDNITISKKSYGLLFE